MDDLKPCPFCDWVAVEIVTENGLSFARCQDCEASTGRTDTGPIAASARWNTRPAATTLEALSAENARLRAFAADAGNQFAFYAENHRAKGTADGLEKAATNQLWAEIARALTGSQSHD